MGLPVEINPLFVSSTGGYQVGRSLRFRSSASAYLNRTPAAASNRKTWTWSGWVKRGTLGVNQHIFGGWDGSNNATGIYFATNDTIEVFSIQVSPTTYSLQLDTTQVFRDPSAWYHFVLAIDTTQATASNRAKLYVNGVQITALSTANYPSQNSDLFVNTNANQFLCRMSWSAASYLDGYLAEVNFIDGQALTPSSFGAYDTNGVWQPAKYTGTYGTNGFYLPFSNTSSTTTLVADSSGNGNNWTPNNISLTAGTTYDSMIDSPTVSASSSNYCVWNPNWKDSTLTISDGNLKVSSASNSNGLSTGTIAVSSGKWYWEATVGGSVSLWAVGIISTSVATPNYTSLTTGNSYAWNNAATKYNGQTGTSYGATYTTGDVLGVALDLDGGTITFYKNNTSQGTAFTGISGTFTPMNLMNASSDVSTNFGQRPFSYTPPTGYSALNTYNLPAATIKNGAQYMAATTYTGNGSTLAVSNGANNTIGTTFQPDFVWMKSRSNAYNNILQDSVRGAGKNLQSNTTNAETGNSGDLLTSFNSNGFTVNNTYLGGTDPSTDGSGATYVGWQWKAGGTGVSNTSGTITSTVSANTTAGFSVVTWTGTFAAATVGHGLGVAPSMIIVKTRTQAAVDWAVYHTSIGATNGLYLNATNAQFATSTWWNNTSPTSSVFSVAGAAQTNGNAQNMVAYCFAAVRGYSAFGSYTGNGSTDGPFIYTGFRPRFILIKNATYAPGLRWVIFDTSRNTYNVTTNSLAPNDSNAEITNSSLDILSNGFKWRDSGGTVNNSGDTFIYAAFAENPFNSSRAR